MSHLMRFSFIVIHPEVYYLVKNVQWIIQVKMEIFCVPDHVNKLNKKG